MQRYFDYGVCHAQQPELLGDFGSAEGEGARFAASELRYVAASAPWLLPLIPLRNAAKYLGYRLGRNFKRLPNSVRSRLSMTRGFWDAPPVGGA
jgi:rhamnosyltransferase